MEFLFLMCSVNSSLKLKQVVMKFVFLYPCLISWIWLKIHFLKSFFVLKNSLTFHGIFLQKVLPAAVLKIHVSVSTAACAKSKKASWVLSIDKIRKTEIVEFLLLKYFWKFMDTTSHSETSLLGKFYMHQ